MRAQGLQGIKCPSLLLSTYNHEAGSVTEPGASLAAAEPPTLPPTLTVLVHVTTPGFFIWLLGVRTLVPRARRASILTHGAISPAPHSPSSLPL